MKPRSNLASPADYAALELIMKRAAQGLPCPDNLTIAIAMRAPTTLAGADALARLEARGLIRIKGFGASRVVMIVETGACTADPAAEIATGRCVICGNDDCQHTASVLGLDLASGPDMSARAFVQEDGLLAACARCGLHTCDHSDLEFAGIAQPDWSHR